MPFRIGTKVNWVALVNFSSEKKKTLVLYSSIETSETKKCSRLWTWSYPHRLIWHFWDLSWWYCSFFNVHIYILPGIEKKKLLLIRSQLNCLLDVRERKFRKMRGWKEILPNDWLYVMYQIKCQKKAAQLVFRRLPGWHTYLFVYTSFPLPGCQF